MGWIFTFAAAAYNIFTFAAAAYNLVRLSNLIPIQAAV